MKKQSIFLACLLYQATCFGAPFHADNMATSAQNKIKLVDPKKTIHSLNGEWSEEHNNQYTNATLNITNAGRQGFDFKFSTAKGANTGELTGKAQFHGNKAVFTQRDNLDTQPNKMPCVVSFKFSDKSIIVDQNAACQNFGGIGAGIFSGNYSKNASPVTSKLVEYGLISNPNQEKKLANLAGQNYKLFIEGCGNQVSEDRLSAEPKAKVRDSFIQGLGSLSGCIIMENDQHVWAAILDSNSHTIKYFTDDMKYANQLPKSILDWVNQINDLNKDNPYTVNLNQGATKSLGQ